MNIQLKIYRKIKGKLPRDPKERLTRVSEAIFLSTLAEKVPKVNFLG